MSNGMTDNKSQWLKPNVGPTLFLQVQYICQEPISRGRKQPLLRTNRPPNVADCPRHQVQFSESHCCRCRSQKRFCTYVQVPVLEHAPHNSFEKGFKPQPLSTVDGVTPYTRFDQITSPMFVV